MTNDTNELVENNLNLANKLAWHYYNRFGRTIEFEELQSVSYLGLVKAAKTFNPELQVVFSTYAYKCISNELLFFHRNANKGPHISIYKEIGEEIYIEDIVSDISNLEDDLFKELEITQLYEFINELPSTEKQVVLYLLKGYTMQRIGDILGCSQPHISRLYHKALNRLRDKFNVKEEP